MAKFEIVMPKLGESVIEATITKWLKSVGDQINEDDPIVEIATDKVDSEIPSPVEGILTKLNYEEGETVPVGAKIASIDMDGEETSSETPENEDTKSETAEKILTQSEKTKPILQQTDRIEFSKSQRFFSPLVKSIAKGEKITHDELNLIKGSGKDGRITKKDILKYIDDKKSGHTPIFSGSIIPRAGKQIEQPSVTIETGDEVIEMDRIRKLIADHMVMSKHTAPHVSLFHEVDVTNIVNWRNKVKDRFLKREGERITFTPLFIEAAAKALRDLPMVNASVDGYNIIKRKNINIGMATALPNGNLIVPVLKNADQKNLVGLAKSVNDLAYRAKNNQLHPDEIQGGTFTITNFGQFGNTTGAPIINQPQVAILGIGTIKKKPVVLETSDGDVIGIRSMVILSLAFDHRIVDGSLGGKFLQEVAKYLENFDTTRIL